MSGLADADTMRRGACPSLSAPMQTGDGLLVRLQPESGVLTPMQLRGLAELAGRHGNGILEITARGNLQIRGLSEASAARLAEGVAALAIEPRRGVPVETNPLAGLDPEEIADATPLASAIRRAISAAGLEARLGPKVTVVVDGGGQIGLSELLADVRVRALPAPADLWEISLGGTATSAEAVGLHAEAEVPQEVVEILGAIAARGTRARGRELLPERVEADAPIGGKAARREAFMVGRIALAGGSQALAMALPFGQIAWTDLARIASQVADLGIEAIRLAPQRRMLLLGDAGQLDALERVAAGLGLVTRADDRRLRVVACAGAPACGSGFIDTKAWAAELAAIAGDGGLHVSGCQKGCAEPTGVLPAVVGISEGEAELRVGAEVRRVEVGREGGAAAILPALRELLASREAPPSVLPDISPSGGEIGCHRPHRVISPFEGEMSGSAEGGWKMRDCRRQPAFKQRHRADFAPPPFPAPAFGGYEAGMSTSAFDYIRDGNAIYEKSFAIIRAEADLSRFAPEEAEVAIRMIHACGQVEAARHFVFSPGFGRAARQALEAGAAVLCDAEMVARGVTHARLPRGNDVLCTLRDPATREIAARYGNRRSAAALELWGEKLAGSVVAIGNAPTALFHLLDMLRAGAPRPAAIIGMPVGFVGAAESKEALAAEGLGIPFATVHGRMGGSAMCSAAVNAVARTGI